MNCHCNPHLGMESGSKTCGAMERLAGASCHPLAPARAPAEACTYQWIHAYTPARSITRRWDGRGRERARVEGKTHITAWKARFLPARPAIYPRDKPYLNPPGQDTGPKVLRRLRASMLFRRGCARVLSALITPLGPNVWRERDYPGRSSVYFNRGSAILPTSRKHCISQYQVPLKPAARPQRSSCRYPSKSSTLVPHTE